VEGEDINLCPDPEWLYVMSREWLWQRPYTTLELQHRLGPLLILSLRGEDINLCPYPKCLIVMSREWLWQRPYM
jgi:hypothetical protein